MDMLEAITEEGPEGKAFEIFLFQGSRVHHEDYGYMDDTGRIGRSGY